jgi:hypothetical protein
MISATVAKAKGTFNHVLGVEHTVVALTYDSKMLWPQCDSLEGIGMTLLSMCYNLLKHELNGIGSWLHAQKKGPWIGW